MKTHFCPEEQTLIAYEGECNWCGEKEHEDERPIQEVFEGVLESTPVSKADEDFPIPIAPV